MRKSERRLFRPSKFHNPISTLFLEEAEKYNFRFLCEDCAYFDHQNQFCVHGYPSDPHRQSYFGKDALGKPLIFCREFDPL